MVIKDVLRVLLKGMGLDKITLDDMEFSYWNSYYWITYSENGRENPTKVGFHEHEGIRLEYNKGKYTLIVADENPAYRFTRDVLVEVPFFEVEASPGNVEQLIKHGVQFSIVEDGKERLRLGSCYSAKVMAVEGDELSLKLHDSTIWVNISENSKIRIYV